MATKFETKRLTPLV